MVAMPPRALKHNISDASDSSAGSQSQGRTKVKQLAKINQRRRESSVPPIALKDQGRQEPARQKKKLADAESNEDSDGPDESRSEEDVDSESGTEGDSEQEEDEFKPKREKKTKQGVSQKDKEKPKVLKMVMLSCAICGKSSKVIPRLKHKLMTHLIFIVMWLQYHAILPYSLMRYRQPPLHLLKLPFLPCWLPFLLSSSGCQAVCLPPGCGRQ